MRRFAILGLLAIFGPALLWMSACATDDSGDAPPPTGEPDSATLPAVDGSALDASPGDLDASSDAPYEAELCNESGWCFTNVPPGATYLEAVSGSAADDVWAVGQSFDQLPIIIHWDGKAWKVSYVGTIPQSAIYSVWAPSRDEAWAVGSPGVMHYEGGTWSIVRTQDDDTILSGVWGASKDDFWVVGTSSTTTDSPWGVQHAERIADGGLKWTSHDLEPGSYGASSVMGRSADDVWISSFQGLWHYTRAADGGAAYAPITTGGNMGNIWVSGDGGLFTGQEEHLRIEAGAAIADPLPHEDAGRFATNFVWGVASNDLWFVGESESATINHWDGTLVKYSHSLLNGAPVPGFLGGVWGSSPSDIWVVGASNYKGVFRGVALHRTTAP